MKTLAEKMVEDQRLVILRVLAAQTQYKANSSVLAMVLDHWGHVVTRDRVKTESRWLAEQGLVTVDDLADGSVLLVQLTARGQDVVEGRAKVDGVSRPAAY